MNSRTHSGCFVAAVLADNNFDIKMQELIEQGMALGGATLKVWYDNESQKICIGYGMADQFVPTKWDNSEVSEGVFVSRLAKDGYYYTRLEWHKWNGDTYTIENELYRSEMKKGGATESQDILGYQYPLNAIYPNAGRLHGDQGNRQEPVFLFPYSHSQQPGRQQPFGCEHLRQRNEHTPRPGHLLRFAGV